MEYVISIFVLGLMVSLLVAKGIVAAQDFATDELKRQQEKAEALNAPT